MRDAAAVSRLLTDNRSFSFDEKSEVVKAGMIRRTFGDEAAMRVVSLDRLATLGEIPRSDHGQTSAVEEAHASASRCGAAARVFTCSHRWLSPTTDPLASHPDDDGHNKARALVEFGRWYESNRRQVGLSTKAFFFIDYSCLDQDAPLRNLPLLPLYVATCHNVVCFETADFADRAW